MKRKANSIQKYVLCFAAGSDNSNHFLCVYMMQLYVMMKDEVYFFYATVIREYRERLDDELRQNSPFFPKKLCFQTRFESCSYRSCRKVRMQFLPTVFPINLTS